MRSAEGAATPLALAAALTAGLLAQALLPAPTPAVPIARTGGRAVAASATPVAIPAPAAYPAVAERPLFAASRSGGGLTAPDVAPPGSFALLGVAIAGGRATAVIRGPGGDRVASPGDTVMGWRVVSVGRGVAVVASGPATQTLRLGGAAAAAGRPPIGRAPAEDAQQ